MKWGADDGSPDQPKDYWSGQCDCGSHGFRKGETVNVDAGVCHSASGCRPATDDEIHGPARERSARAKQLRTGESKGMRHEDCKVGMRVRYQPVMRKDEPSYEGAVREEPWQLGDGTWVTHLTDMEPAYGEATGNPGRTHVHAARMQALTAVKP